MSTNEGNKGNADSSTRTVLLANFDFKFLLFSALPLREAYSNAGYKYSVLMSQTSAMAEGRTLPVFKSDMDFCNDSAMLSEVRVI